MSLLLLFLGHVVTAVALAGVHNETGLNLDCTNDLESLMFCQLEAQNCTTDYNLTIQSNQGYGAVSCILQQCDTGRCCCTLTMTLVPRETHTATVWRDGKSFGTKEISVSDTVKPKTPTIVSVNESKGNFEVKWRSNIDRYIGETLTEVTFYKKGDTKKVSKRVNPAFVDGLNFHSINGQQLEPSTTYLVSVRTRARISGKFSNSSNELEFTTSPSPVPVFPAIIIGLSITAIVLTGVIYGSYVKCKTKWWDTVVKDLNPKLLNMHPGKPELLKPSAPIISPVSVTIRDDCNSLDDSNKGLKQLLIDTSSGSLQQSSGISTGSSGLSYANTEPVEFSLHAVQEALHKALPNIGQMPVLTINPFTEFNSDDGVKVHDMSSGSSGFDNKTYSLLIPRESTYHPSESNTVTCPIQQVPTDLSLLQKNLILSSVDSSVMVIEDSYRQCNAESGRFSYAEDSSLSSSSSDINTADRCDLVSRTEAGCEGSEEVDSDGPNLNVKSEEASLCDQNPSHGSLVVDNDYQSFQSLVRQPDVSFSEEKSGEQGERLDKYQDESLIKIPPSVLGPMITPSMFMSAELSPITVVSDYHSV